MCFSASASFGASIVLTVIGVASIKKAQHPTQLLFAGIPLIFAIQQLSEGMLWLNLPNPDNLIVSKVYTYIFLGFAQIVWPIWVPIAVLLTEKQSARKPIQRLLVGSGVAVGLYLAYCLMIFHVEAKIVGHHIAYIQNYPSSLRITVIILYASATILPLFFSHIKHMWMLGATILISYYITTIFYHQYVLSVWCFFSSLISLFIYAIMVGILKSTRKEAIIYYP
ncbi:MAG: hypothetical protein EAY81_08885 [Bacteroidetes bacterium]|nr:MAG: hypothetical protein EAY81_08885 [Bacteroidota bacterium]